MNKTVFELTRNTFFFRVNYIDFLAPYSPLKSKERHDDLMVRLGEEGQPSSRIDMSDPVIKKIKDNVGLFQLK